MRLPPIDLNIGLDGLLYVLSPGGLLGGQYLDVYDPISLTHIRSLNLKTSLGTTAHRSIAVNSEGDIFVADPDGELHHLSPTGDLLGTTQFTTETSVVDLYDVDILPNGSIILGDGNGRVFLTNEDFSVSSSFVVGTSYVFVSYVPHIPEPATALLLLLMVGLKTPPGSASKR